MSPLTAMKCRQLTSASCHHADSAGLSFSHKKKKKTNEKMKLKAQSILKVATSLNPKEFIGNGRILHVKITLVGSS